MLIIVKFAGICTRTNWCVDCDDLSCVFHGNIESDCPKYRCDSDSLDCDRCEFIHNLYDHAHSNKNDKHDLCPYCTGVIEHMGEFNGYRGAFGFCPVCGRKIEEN